MTVQTGRFGSIGDTGGGGNELWFQVIFFVGDAEASLRVCVFMSDGWGRVEEGERRGGKR